MSVEKLNIQEKADNPNKKALLARLGVPQDESLSAQETNKLVGKTNELVEKTNELNQKFDAYKPVNAFNFKGNVATYANLPTSNLVKDDAYGVIADGLVYIYNGTSFPTSGNGLNLGLKPIGEVKAGDALAVSGNQVFENINEIRQPYIYYRKYTDFTTTTTVIFGEEYINDTSKIKVGVLNIKYKADYTGRFIIYGYRTLTDYDIIKEFTETDFTNGIDFEIIIDSSKNYNYIAFRTFQVGVVINDLSFYNYEAKFNLPPDVLRTTNINKVNGVAGFNEFNSVQSNFTDVIVGNLLNNFTTTETVIFGNYNYKNTLREDVLTKVSYKADYTGRFIIYGYRTLTDYDIIKEFTETDFTNGIDFEIIIDSSKNYNYIAFRTFQVGVVINYIKFIQSQVVLPPKALKNYNVNFWNDKIISLYGDSITAINNGDYTSPIQISNTKWGTILASDLNAIKMYARGIGGQKYAWGVKGGSVAFIDANGNYRSRDDSSNYDDYTGLIPEGTTKVRGAFSSWLRIITMFPDSIKDDIDLVVVMGSTNDSIDNSALEFVPSSVIDTEWSQSSYYSEYNGDYNIGTLRGGISSTIMKLQAWMPQALIVISTPLPGRGATGVNNPALFNVDEFQKSVIVRDVASRFSIPILDLNAKSGINSLNRKTFITDSVHPYNEEGNKNLARTLIGELRGIKSRY